MWRCSSAVRSGFGGVSSGMKPESASDSKPEAEAEVDPATEPHSNSGREPQSVRTAATVDS